MVPGSGKLVVPLLYPFLTKAWVYVMALGTTIMLFSYRLSDRVLLRIHASRILQISLASVAILMVVVSMGRCFLLFELLMMLLMAGIIIPSLSSHLHPGEKQDGRTWAPGPWRSRQPRVFGKLISHIYILSSSFSKFKHYIQKL